jgi:tetratricopeptide (TPR) repeat protein
MEPGSGKNWIVLFGSPSDPLMIVFGPAAISFFQQPELAFALAKSSSIRASTLLVRGGSNGWTLLTTPTEPGSNVERFARLAHVAAADLVDDYQVTPTEDRVLETQQSAHSASQLPALLRLPATYLENRFPSETEEFNPVGHARALDAVGRPKRAEVVLTNALPFDDSGVVHFHLGEVVAAAGDANRALPLLERAFALAPKQADVAQALGIVYIQLGRAEDALRTFQQAATIADTFETWANVSTAAFNIEKYSIAYDAAKKMIVHERSDGHGYFLAAAAAKKLGHDEDARQQLKAGRRAPKCSVPPETIEWAVRAAEAGDGDRSATPGCARRRAD